MASAIIGRRQSEFSNEAGILRSQLSPLRQTCSVKIHAVTTPTWFLQVVHAGSLLILIVMSSRSVPIDIYSQRVAWISCRIFTSLGWEFGF